MLRSILTYSGAFALALLISCPVVAMHVDSRTKAEAERYARSEYGIRRERGGGFRAPLMTLDALKQEYIDQKMGALAEIEALRLANEASKNAEVIEVVEAVKADQPAVAQAAPVAPVANAPVAPAAPSTKLRTVGKIAAVATLPAAGLVLANTDKVGTWLGLAKDAAMRSPAWLGSAISGLRHVAAPGLAQVAQSVSPAAVVEAAQEALPHVAEAFNQF